MIRNSALFLILFLSTVLSFAAERMLTTKVMSTDPFGLLPEGRFEVMLVKKLPESADLNSPVYWLKDKKSFLLVQEILRKKVPLVIGKIPEGTIAEAFVLPIGFQLTVDVLRAAKDVDHHNILFLQSSATQDIIAHEFQHWNDYEDGTFDRFMNELVQFQKKSKISDEELVIIQNAVVEIRGHAAQEQVLLVNKTPNLTAAINEISVKYSDYAYSLLPVLNKLKNKSPQNLKSLLALLKRYELTEKGKLSFSTLLKNWY